MVFSNVAFVYLFLPIMLILHKIIPKKAHNALLLIASLFAYALFSSVLLIPLVLSIGIGFIGGICIRIMNTSLKRKIILGTVIALNGYVLFLSHALIPDQIPSISMVFLYTVSPVGIVIYTLESIGYVVDIYKGNIEVENNLLHFALYLSFFPKIAAGPYIEYKLFKKQLSNREVNLNAMSEGVGLFIIGLSKKVLLADGTYSAWLIIEREGPENVAFLTAWFGIIAFALHIYYNLTGYTDMARGVSRMFGFSLPKSFGLPYTSYTFSGFFKQWNVTVSKWFYTYIFKPLKKRFPLKITVYGITLLSYMLIGLWYGLSVNYFLWGIYCGTIVLVSTQLFNNIMEKVPHFIRGFLTGFLVLFGWTFFISSDMQSVFEYMKTLLGINFNVIANQNTLMIILGYGIVVAVGIICATHFGRVIRSLFKKWYPYIKPFVEATLLLACTSFMVNNSFNSLLNW